MSYQILRGQTITMDGQLVEECERETDEYDDNNVPNSLIRASVKERVVHYSMQSSVWIIYLIIIGERGW